MEDLKKLKVKNWKEAAKDRRTWKDLVEKAKTHKGLQCQMDDDDYIIIAANHRTHLSKFQTMCLT